MTTRYLPPTNSVNELRHRASRYARGELVQTNTNSQNSTARTINSIPISHATRASMHAATIRTSLEASSTTGSTRTSLRPTSQPQLTAAQLEIQRQYPTAPAAASYQTSQHRSPISRESYHHDDSDSGCSTCSGSRHDDDYTSYSSSEYSHPRRRSRRSHSHQPGAPSTQLPALDHSDCISCTSSCSCSSGCDSDGENDMTDRTRRHSHHSHSRHSLTASEAISHGVSPNMTTVPSVSAMPSQTPSQPPSEPSSQAVSQLPSRSVSQMPTQRSVQSRVSQAQPQAAPVTDGVATEMKEQSEIKESFADTVIDNEDTLDPTQTDSLHVTFLTPREQHGHKEGGVTSALQQPILHESALACLERAQLGFHSYVLTSDQAATPIDPEAPDGYPPATSLLRKLIRHEPRVSKISSHPSVKVTEMKAVETGGGNLVFYSLVFDGANRPQKFKLSKKEQEEVARLKELEHETDVRPDGKRRLTADDLAHPDESPFSSDKYAHLLEERKKLQLTIERKVGVIPIRRIREMRSGIVPGAVRLVNAVNDRFDELNIAEDETIIPEHCVSLYLDSGVRRPHPSTDYPDSSPTRLSMHDRNHLECIARFTPELCPRVHSSFTRANETTSRRVQREIRRNQRKNFARGRAPMDVWNATNADGATNQVLHAPDVHLSLTTSTPSTHLPSQVHPVSSWVVIATNSAEEASVLLNSLMFLKLVAGKQIHRKKEEKKHEVVNLPTASPSDSPVKKRSKFDHDHQQQPPIQLLQPNELTSALMTTSESTMMDVSPARPPPVSSQRAVLKRKSQATPSVKAVFSMPNASAVAKAAVPTPNKVVASSKKKSPKKGNKENIKPKTLNDQWVEAVAACDFKPASSGSSIIRHGGQPLEELDANHPNINSTAVASTPQKISSFHHPLSSNTAIFTPSSFHHPSQQSHDTTIPLVISNPPASVDDWLAQKQAQQEKERRAAERRQRLEQEEKAQKKLESEAAIKRWEEKQLRLKEQRLRREKRKKAAEEKAAEEKAAQDALRKAACVKAYQQFSARYDEKKEKEMRESIKSTAAASQEARRKKQEAKKKFEEWVKKKSDWFVGRVAQIKQKQKERRERGDGDMNDEDPEEEAALDWQWLEKEVESELQAASSRYQEESKQEPQPQHPPAAPPKRRSKKKLGRVKFKGHSTQLSIDPMDDSDLLNNVSDIPNDSAIADPVYQVLDEVDVELWQKLMAGLEEARSEIARLKQGHTPLGQAIQEGDVQRIQQAAAAAAAASSAASSSTPLTQSLNGHGQRQHENQPASSTTSIRTSLSHGSQLRTGGISSSAAQLTAGPHPISQRSDRDEPIAIHPGDRSLINAINAYPTPYQRQRF